MPDNCVSVTMMPTKRQTHKSYVVRKLLLHLENDARTSTAYVHIHLMRRPFKLQQQYRKGHFHLGSYMLRALPS
jgi:hypothetical protein